VPALCDHGSRGLSLKSRCEVGISHSGPPVTGVTHAMHTPVSPASR
jgi:hypothetical protein